LMMGLSGKVPVSLLLAFFLLAGSADGFFLKGSAGKVMVKGYHTKLSACKMCFAKGCDAHCLVGFCHKLYSEYTVKGYWCTECTSVMDATTTSLGFQNECSQAMNEGQLEQPWHSRWWYVHHEKSLTANTAQGPLLPVPEDKKE